VPHPRALNRDFSLTLATGLPAGVEDDGPGLARFGFAVDLLGLVSRCSSTASRITPPSPSACKVAAARQLRHTVGVFAWSPDGREPWTRP
jgi:hypothetical protein